MKSWQSLKKEERYNQLHKKENKYTGNIGGSGKIKLNQRFEPALFVYAQKGNKSIGGND